MYSSRLRAAFLLPTPQVLRGFVFLTGASALHAGSFSTHITTPRAMVRLHGRPRDQSAARRPGRVDGRLPRICGCRRRAHPVWAAGSCPVRGLHIDALGKPLNTSELLNPKQRSAVTVRSPWPLVPTSCRKEMMLTIRCDFSDSNPWNIGIYVRFGIYMRRASLLPTCSGRSVSSGECALCAFS